MTGPDTDLLPNNFYTIKHIALFTSTPNQSLRLKSHYVV